MHTGGLSLNTAVPVALMMLPFACCLFLAGYQQPLLGKNIGIGVLLLQLLLIISMILGFDSTYAMTQYSSLWQPVEGLKIVFAIDGISLVFLLISNLLALAALVHPPQVATIAQCRENLLAVLVIHTQLTACFMVQDMMQFVIMDSMGLMPVLWILSRHTNIKLQLLLGQCLMISGTVALLLWIHDATGSWVMSPDVLSANPLDPKVQNILFFLLFYGLCFRLGQFPFHNWLPTWLSAAPCIQIPLVFLGVKSGIYLLLRFIMPGLADAVAFNAPFIRILGMTGAIYGAALAMIQINAMKQLAYAFVSQSGLLLLGLFALQESAQTGSTMLALQYGLSACGLLVATQMSSLRSRTMLIPRMGGLLTSIPQIGVLFLVSTLGSIAMPGTGGFDGTHLLIEGLVSGGNWMVAMGVGIVNVMTASFLLWTFQKQFLAKRVESRLVLLDIRVSPCEMILVLSLTALMLFSGITSQYWIQLVQSQPHEKTYHNQVNAG